MFLYKALRQSIGQFWITVSTVSERGVKIRIRKLGMEKYFRPQKPFITNIYVVCSFCYGIDSIVYFHVFLWLGIKSFELFGNIRANEAILFFDSLSRFHRL